MSNTASPFPERGSTVTTGLTIALESDDAYSISLVHQANPVGSIGVTSGSPQLGLSGPLVIAPGLTVQVGMANVKLADSPIRKQEHPVPSPPSLDTDGQFVTRTHSNSFTHPSDHLYSQHGVLSPGEGSWILGVGSPQGAWTGMPTGGPGGHLSSVRMSAVNRRKP